MRSTLVTTAPRMRLIRELVQGCCGALYSIDGGRGMGANNGFNAGNLSCCSCRCTAWGRPVDQVLDVISPEPIAAASLGQVYRGRLVADGQEVALPPISA